VSNELQTQGFLRIPNLLSIDDRKVILATAELAHKGRYPAPGAGLKDSADLVNTWYKSRRSPNMQYMYLQAQRTQAIGDRVAMALERRTKLTWRDTGINQHMLPLFDYEAGGHIEAHRGRDIGYGDNDFVAVAMLTRSKIDFNAGEFYLNAKADASADGKTVFNDNHEDRMYFDLQPGEVLVFDNRRFVHGTTPITPALAGCHRTTCSWRTSTTARVQIPQD
jgi:hypothetical protein